MKKLLLFSFVCLAFIAASFTNPPGKLIGRWRPKLPGNISVIVAYRTDGTFDIFMNGKTFVSGMYKVNQDTLSISDPICGRGYYGTYLLTYITEDSVRQTLIQDTCQVRRNSVASTPTMGRIKAAKP